MFHFSRCIPPALTIPKINSVFLAKSFNWPTGVLPTLLAIARHGPFGSIEHYLHSRFATRPIKNFTYRGFAIAKFKDLTAPNSKI